ncbi:MAG: penicillin-insensitive murein endopeptidase [Gammaproteobacteria bacterium]|nr:penicillin-insensitive murein endopeptidase [Gammaproteobacteria bacterium]
MKNILLFILFIPIFASAQTSTCYGTTSNGYLKNGIQLPERGKNYEAYSYIARMAGRTYVHSSVKTIIVNAYANLEVEQPMKLYKYAETGFKNGGQFKPHKTHRNGLSVDFMTPVMLATGKSVHLPTNPLNKFGYNIEFDKNSKYDEFTIDYEAMAAHLMALHKEAKKSGFDLWRVIFDPKLQNLLFNTKYGDYLKQHIQFSKKPSWVRHDEHYHVDFDIPCQ